jgi:hypothetical protein
MKKKVQAKTRQGYKGCGCNPTQERRVISKKKKSLQPTKKTYTYKREGHSAARKWSVQRNTILMSQKTDNP